MQCSTMPVDHIVSRCNCIPLFTIYNFDSPTLPKRTLYYTYPIYKYTILKYGGDTFQSDIGGVNLLVCMQNIQIRICVHGCSLTQSGWWSILAHFKDIQPFRMNSEAVQLRIFLCPFVPQTSFGCQNWSQNQLFLPRLVPEKTFGRQNLTYPAISGPWEDQFWLPKVVLYKTGFGSQHPGRFWQA